MEPVSRFGSGPWASSSSLVTRRGFRRFSFKKIRGWGATRRRGRCCTSFGQGCRPFRRATPYEQHLMGDIEADETYIGGYRKGRNGRGVGNVGVGIAEASLSVLSSHRGGSPLYRSRRCHGFPRPGLRRLPAGERLVFPAAQRGIVLLAPERLRLRGHTARSASARPHDFAFRPRPATDPPPTL